MQKYLLLNERAKKELQGCMPEEKQIARLADYFQNLADRTRIKILSALSISSLCVSDLSNILGINQTTISHQLKLLKDQGVVSFKRSGKILVYSLCSQSINDILYYAVAGDINKSLAN